MILQYETEHYIFHYLSGSLTEHDIIKIAECQENCFEKICRVLEISYPRKIGYWLYDSPHIIGNIFYDGSPINGISILGDGCDIGRQVSLSGDSENIFVIEPYSVHAVYEDKIKCIGEHEDTHIISTQISEWSSIFLMEGLAMFMDGVWWKIDNKAWARYYMEYGEPFSISDMICFDLDGFYEVDTHISYPIAGAVTEYIIQKYGIEKYKQFYCADEYVRKAVEIYGVSLDQIHKDFISWLSELDISKDVYEQIKSQLVQ